MAMSDWDRRLRWSTTYRQGQYSILRLWGPRPTWPATIPAPGGGPQTADDLAKTAVFDGSLYTPPVTSPTLFNTTTYYSALYNSPFSTRWFVITFGTDTSLTTGPGWDNVTGVGTPNGLNFVNAIAP